MSWWYQQAAQRGPNGVAITRNEALKRLSEQWGVANHGSRIANLFPNYREGNNYLATRPGGIAGLFEGRD